MSYQYPGRQTQRGENPVTRSSPLRNSSTASTNSSAYSASSNPFVPTRTSTLSSTASSGYQYQGAGHKRGISETAPMGPSATEITGYENNAAGGYKSARQSLRPLPQAPNASPPSAKKTHLTHSRIQSYDEAPKYQYTGPAYSPTSLATQPSGPNAIGLGRADSVSRRSQQHSSTSSHAPVLSTPDLQNLKSSTTSHLRTLSKFAGNESSEDFSIDSPTPSVVGMRGRRQLKRTDSTRGSKGTTNVRTYAWGERNWMDKQRQFLQAYEYLCHIGEAKEWIEDIIDKPIPPIIQLEEALRDGVTLAEVVQALHPNQPMRIFRNPKLQFRHSDNIALFFRFLAEVELPELFRFELIDLYEKKNIPKVIYCIHALSWLLYRKGIVDFRIGNLVGQLEFEHHELEEMQKGLDKSGVSMPSFSGMGASFGAEPEPEPEPEPIESEEERIERELGDKKGSVLELQAQLRGAMVRIGLGYTMQNLWDSEERLVELQSIIRGAWARQIAEYRLSMQIFATNLQSAARGVIIRRRQQSREERWKGSEKDVILLQSLVRARKSRVKTQNIRVQVRREESGIRKFQAAFRGALERQRFDEQYAQARDSEGPVTHLQAAVRGLLQRREVNNLSLQNKRSEKNVIRLQAAIRGHLHRERLEEDQRRLLRAHGAIVVVQKAARAAAVRSAMARQNEALRNLSGLWRALQSASRGALSRRRCQDTKKQLLSHQSSFIAIQALTRAQTIRNEVKDINQRLASSTNEITSLQSVSRACLVRTKVYTDLQSLEAAAPAITKLQASARGWLCRQGVQELQEQLQITTPEVVQLQSLARAMMIRSEIGSLLAELEDVEPAIAELQAAIRGMMVREKFVEKKAFFKANMEKVVKVQSFVRGKLQGEAYKSLTNGTNPPVGTVKGFVHLLNDSDFDFDEEVEFERLRKTVVQHVRQNELADQYITQLDIKIALLVKNKITLDEVVKHQKHFGGDAGSLLTNREISSKDPFDLKALNKTSRRKLEHYQELFFILQTQPQYLARLFQRIREQATAEKECERIKHLMMGLFGYAQKRREEYYLIKLITRSIKEEIDHCPSIKDYLRGNFFWAKIFGAYVKSPRDRKYMRDFLGPIIKENVIDNPELDLESDPMQIYLSAIENEQLRTGRRSNRSPDIPREEAIRDEETKRTFIAHLQDLRDIADQFFALLEEQLHKMPYGVRYIAQQMFNYLTGRFPHEEQSHTLQIVGHWVWKAYLQPALLEPEKHGAIDRGLSQEHKRNLGQVVKLLGQIAAGRLFGGENVFLQPLNSYVRESIERLGDIWSNLINVSNAEETFDIDEFNDLYARTKPTLYIKMADIFSIHHLVAADQSYICPGHDDLLREVIRELGSAKNNEHELMNVSSSEICLTLNPKLHEAEDPDSEVKGLFTETKRCILYIIRVQSGSNLLEIMVKPILPEDEDRWDSLVHDELSTTSRKRGAYAEATFSPLLDIASMTYAELKRTALENILRLERAGRLTRHNHYQDLLNAIAVDIRTKHRRRVQRQRELEGVKLTLARLNDQAGYLEGQLKTYNDYIEQAMVTLQNKKGKKRFLMPFTKQWDHERELARSGRVPKFGSFKYSAQDLANRGILVSWAGYPERVWDKIDLTISSNEVGVFSIEGSNGPISIPGASAQIPLDDLLQAQFNNTQFLEFFGTAGGGGGSARGSGGRAGEGDGVRVNVNLFLHLIMRKFYKDRDS